jgi:hypothetical protein
VRLTPNREEQIRKECVGRGMVHAHFLFELFDEIRALEHEKKMLSDMLFSHAKRLRDEGEEIRPCLMSLIKD